jgi:hypothetical protein
MFFGKYLRRELHRRVGPHSAEVKATIPAANAPPPSSFQFPIQINVVGVDLADSELGPFSITKEAAGRRFTTADSNADVTVVDSAHAAAHRLWAGSTVIAASTPIRVIGTVTDSSQGSNPTSTNIPLGRAQALARVEEASAGRR